MFEPVSIGLTIAKFAVAPVLRKMWDKKIKKDDRQEEGIIVVELARPIKQAVIDEFGEEKVVATISYERPITKDELHKLATDIYKAIMATARFYKRVGVVTSGPNALWVLVGQFIGMHHVEITWYWWQPEEGYIPVEDASKYRHLLF
ncbi:MAG: hypothetical protein J7J44_02505 [Deltaproteobacteria bacterium]|nr:hypothetical protein [Deltaproteobacteria bacterium]